jgi:hypothetical protein
MSELNPSHLLEFLPESDPKIADLQHYPYGHLKSIRRVVTKGDKQTLSIAQRTERHASFSRPAKVHNICGCLDAVRGQ